MRSRRKDAPSPRSYDLRVIESQCSDVYRRLARAPLERHPAEHLPPPEAQLPSRTLEHCSRLKATMTNARILKSRMRRKSHVRFCSVGQDREALPYHNLGEASTCELNNYFLYFWRSDWSVSGEYIEVSLAPSKKPSPKASFQ